MGASVAMAAPKPLPVGGLLRADDFFFFLLPLLPIKRIVDDDCVLCLIRYNPSGCVKAGIGIEISPELNNLYEQNIAKKYKNIADNLNLEFLTIKADSVDVEKHSKQSTKYIHSKILKNSNYYKNMILKMSEIEKHFNNL